MGNVLKQGPLTVYHQAPSHSHSTFGSGFGANDTSTVPPTGTAKEALGDAKIGLHPERYHLSLSPEGGCSLASPAISCTYVFTVETSTPSACQHSTKRDFCCPEQRASSLTSLTWWSAHRPQPHAPCSHPARVSREPRAPMELLSL